MANVFGKATTSILPEKSSKIKTAMLSPALVVRILLAD
jgi:hypothetical protein